MCLERCDLLFLYPELLQVGIEDITERETTMYRVALLGGIGVLVVVAFLMTTTQFSPVAATSPPSSPFVFELKADLDRDMAKERNWAFDDVAVRLNVPRIEGTIFTPDFQSLADCCRADDLSIGLSIGLPNFTIPIIIAYDPRSLGQRHAEAMLREQHKIPPSLRKHGLFFMGTKWWDVLEPEKAMEYVPFLRWQEDAEKWILDFYCLKNYDHADVAAGETALKFNKNAIWVINKGQAL